MAKRQPPSGGQPPPGSDDLAAFRQRRAESHRIKEARRQVEHDRRQHAARMNRAHGLRDPWGTGYRGDAMAVWDIDQADERVGYYDLHHKDVQDPDGAPALRDAFLRYLCRAVNAAAAQRPDGDAQLADAQAGDPWLNPRQIAGLLRMSTSTVHRAIHNKCLAARQPGGQRASHYEIAIPAFADYLARTGYDRAAVAQIGRRLQKLLGRKAAAPGN